MEKNSYRSNIYHLTIEEYDKVNDKHVTELDINNYLQSEMRIEFYAFIKHDSDTNDVGEKERVHYHVSIKLNQSYARNTIFNAFASGLLINVNCVQARHVKNFVLSTQYLIHKNNKEKYQYDFIDLWTNNFDELHKIIYEGKSDYELDVSYLIDLVNKHTQLTDLYKELGLVKSRQYRSLILDMWKEKNFLW